MKKFVALATLAVSLNAMATGEFLFSNVNAPALTNYWFGAVGPTATNANGFYYGFFIAPLGTSDPEQFTFSGSYATNATTVGGFGRLVGGVASAGGIEPGDQVSTLVRGWSSSLGHDWVEIDQQRQLGWSSFGFYGESSIGELYAGGGIYPLSPVMGQGPGSIPGITLYAVPEPSIPTLLGFGLCSLFRRRRGRLNQQ